MPAAIINADPNIIRSTDHVGQVGDPRQTFIDDELERDGRQEENEGELETKVRRVE